MKILFVATEDSTSRSSWSGTPYYMSSALMQFGHVQRFRLRRPARVPLGVAARLGSRLSGSWVQLNRSQVELRLYTIQVETAIHRFRPDIVVSPATTPFSYTRASVPLVSWTDAVFSQMVSYYPEFSGISDGTIQRGVEQEKRALSRVTVAAYSSTWAAAEAVRVGADERKIIVAPFGPNLELREQDSGLPQGILSANLLFVGGDWLRKGGDIATAAVEVLRSRGVNATLTVVGARPPIDLPYVHWLGSLSKDDPSQLRELIRHFRDSAALILPTRADCTPVVITEAIRLGLPVLASRTGGVTEMVENHAVGAAVHQGDQEAERFADEFEALMADSTLSHRRIKKAQAAERTLDYAESFSRILKHIGLD